MQCLPHMRGGVFLLFEKGAYFSRLPHMRGGVLFLRVISFRMISLPHMRGGVSHAGRLVISADLSSPHAWGCFRMSSTAHQREVVFPTCVGVFLS